LNQKRKHVQLCAVAAGVLSLASACAPNDSSETDVTSGHQGLDATTVTVDERGQVDLLQGKALGQVRTSDGSAAAMLKAVQQFLAEHGSVYGLAKGEVVDTTLVTSNKVGRGQRIVLQQLHRGLPVEDGQLTAIFDEHGALRDVIGHVQPAAALDRLIRGGNERLSLDVARNFLARERGVAERALPFDLASDRILSVRHGSELWRVRVADEADHAEGAEVWVSAAGEVIDRIEHVGHDAREVDIRAFDHANGAAFDLTTQVEPMNVDVEKVGPLNLRCEYSLQRLGSGRARMWNAKNVANDDDTPLFTRRKVRQLCGLPAPAHFTTQPGTDDEDWVFNEQQTYFWAQSFKTMVDEWGREANAMGEYEPDAARKVNVEIVVNGDSSRETDWCISVQHGCFVNDVAKSRFSGIDTDLDRVPTVYLFNSAGNSGSPQFQGSEVSPTYAIVIHEVGHFVSWTYGNWSAANNRMRSSLNEGFSMVMPALYAADKWTAIDYADSAEVTTGSRIGGVQWTHHVRGTAAQVYSAMDCDATNGVNSYQLAWPFVQAMWHLAHNVDEDGNAIFTSQQAAVHNAADMMMYALSALTANSTMNWKKLSNSILSHLEDQIDANVTEGMPSGRDPVAQVRDVFDEHGLLDDCSP
jgi:hypothetical protein